jgi:hypothetical protein
MASTDGKQIKPWDPDCDPPRAILEQHAMTLTPPTPGQLLASPFVDSWSVTNIGDLPVLVGATYGVFGARDGMVGFTPPLIKIDEDGGWAATISGFYRLGDRSQRIPS